MPLLGRLKGLVYRRHGDPFRFWAKHLPFHTAGISFTDSHLFEKYHFFSAVNCRVNLSFRNLEVSLKKYELEDSPRIHLPKTLIPQVNFYASPPSPLPPTQACWGRYKDGVYWKYSVMRVRTHQGSLGCVGSGLAILERPVFSLNLCPQPLWWAKCFCFQMEYMSVSTWYPCGQRNLSV